jgi:hypothetical protein
VIAHLGGVPVEEALLLPLIAAGAGSAPPLARA